MIITKTPLRLPLGGGGTDLPFFYPHFGGELVTAAIDKYIYVTVSERKFHKEFRVAYSKTENINTVTEIENARVREALKLLDITKPLEITTISEVPGSSGLGSSSAFVVGLLKALHAYKRESVSSKMLAEEASKIEIDLIKEPIGKQDQYASALGGINHLKITKEGSVLPSPLNLSYETVRDLESNSHMFFTGLMRDAREVLKDQAKSTTNDKDKMESMKQIKDIGIEIKNALEKGDTKKFGKLMNLHWETKKRTSGKISDSQIDAWYEKALKNGALGGKIMGAGGGGFFLFYCESNAREFIRAMEKEGLMYVPFRFDMDGSKILLDVR
ncbi:MAG: galactokinase [Nanoarchaeota archaeon]|nr:galactokinase [Nanoarchaeota archaeon]